MVLLNEGHIAEPMLDFFRQEPLPPTHSFWNHLKVTITPHNANDSHPRWIVVAIGESLRRARAGEELLNIVDASLSY